MTINTTTEKPAEDAYTPEAVSTTTGTSAWRPSEPRLEQLGQSQPTIRVDFRRWEGRKQHIGEVFRLTIDDAREFMAALGYLIVTAES